MSTSSDPAAEDSSSSASPLLSEPMSLMGFLKHLDGESQLPHSAASSTSTSSLESCLKGSRSNKHNNNNNNNNITSPKSVRYCTNQDNGKVWCIVKTYAKPKKKYRPDLWWDKQTLLDRGTTDLEMAGLVENRFANVLHDCYDTIQRKGRTYDIQRDLLDTVDFDHDAMQECAAARGLEALVDPEIQQNVKKHCKAVLTAQDLLWEQGHDLDSERAIRLIAEASAKYSHASRVFVKKIAKFDEQQAREYLWSGDGGFVEDRFKETKTDDSRSEGRLLEETQDAARKKKPEREVSVHEDELNMATASQ